MQCGSCRQDNPAGTRFCGHCGAALRADAISTAELRQLTVLFCDLVGSTALSESLDPEDLREVTGAYQAVCEAAIRRHDGHIAQYLGDGLLVYFGYPAAHEDDGRRAVRAALEIVEDLSTVSSRMQTERGITLQVRLGIHTGPVVVGDVGGGDRREQLAMGMTPNLAARIQNIATPGTVLVSEDTYAIVRGFFEFSPLGAHEIKGLAKPVTLYRVVAESGADSRLDVQRRVGLTPLTGRAKELACLDELWSGVQHRGGHTLLVQGEAGIGKSRIVDAFREHVVRQAGTVLECFCTPYAQSTTLFPVVGMVERVLGFTRETPEAEKRAMLESRLARRGILTPETAALMGALLSIPPTDNDPLINYSPQRRRERTLETLMEWLLAVTHERPTLWVVEDMHWVDPTTVELLTSVLRSLASAPLLVILTYRPNFSAPWHANGRVSEMSLRRLGPEETTSMAVSVAHKAMPIEVLSQIVSRTEGIPLFVEEVTKAVLELGFLTEREDRFELSSPLPPDLIPSTVQGSLNARLDRLGPAKAVAQLAATIGREFSFALLSAVAEDGEAELRRGLERLAAAELLSRMEDLPDETYIFKHALVRDAAYQSLLRKSRRGLHERIGEALVARFPETAQHHPELVAEHFTAAGRVERALPLWLAAGQQAVARAANHEALAHLRRGLELAGELSGDEQYRQQLEFLMAMIPALIGSQGWASAELEKVYRQAEELVTRVPDTPHRMNIIGGITAWHLCSGRVIKALERHSESFKLASTMGNPLLIAMGHQTSSAIHMYNGSYRLAIEHGDQGLAMLNLDSERLIARWWALAPGVGILAYTKSAWWMLGFPECAIRTAERCVTLAQEVGHAPSTGFALAARVSSLCQERDALGVLPAVEEASRLAHEERLGFYHPVLAIHHGWALAELGDAAGLAKITSGFDLYRITGNGIEQIRFHALLAAVQWKSKEWDQAFLTLENGMALAAENGEGFYEPELYRMKGEFLFEQATGQVKSPKTGFDRDTQLALAESYIKESIEKAASQEAKMLELRSRVTLCRLRREIGTVEVERDALAKAYSGFTEGFETLELREARAMLEALKT